MKINGILEYAFTDAAEQGIQSLLSKGEELKSALYEFNGDADNRGKKIDIAQATKIHDLIEDYSVALTQLTQTGYSKSIPHTPEFSQLLQEEQHRISQQLKRVSDALSSISENQYDRKEGVVKTTSEHRDADLIIQSASNMLERSKGALTAIMLLPSHTFGQPDSKPAPVTS